MNQRKNIVASSSVSKSYQLKMLQESKTNQVMGTMFYPFDALFFESGDNQDLEKLSLYTKLLKLDTKDYIKDVSNFDDLIRFAQECEAYGIHLEENKFEKDSKNYEVIKAIKHLNIKIKPVINVHYLKQGLSHAQLSYLKRTEATEIKEEARILNPSVIKAEALNPIHEIEHALLSIVQNKRDDAVLYVDDKNASLPYIIYACEKLGIEYSSNSSDYKLSKMIASSLLEVYIAAHFDKEMMNTKILNIFKRNVFNLKHAKQISDMFLYMRMPLENNKFEFDIDERKNEAINEEYLSVINILEKLQKHNIKDALEMIYELTHFLNKQGSTIIKTYFQNIIPIVNQDNIHFVLHELENLSTYDFESEFFSVLDYSSSPTTPFKHVFITGLNAGSYPNIKEKTGLINEALIDALDCEIMSLEARITHTENLKKSMFNNATESMTVYSHELDLEGANVDEALLEENLFNNATKIKVDLNYEVNDYFIQQPSLNQESIDKSFKQNGIISLSPSRMKAYVDDPIQYVKDYILKARIDNLDMKPHLIFGNLNHALLEKHYKNEDTGECVSNYKAQYPDVSYKDLLFDLNNHIMQEFIQISDAELIESGYAVDPRHVEYTGLKTVINLDEDKQVEIFGRVDRFDTKGETIRIIDYKASEQRNFSKRFKGVTASSQLQLLSYMMLLQHEFESYTIENAQFVDYEIRAGKEEYEVKPRSITSKFDFNTELQLAAPKDLIVEGWEEIFKTVLLELVTIIEEGNLNKNDILERLKESTKV